jgi:hypothetical protein
MCQLSDSGQAGALSQLEITPAMREAGVAALEAMADASLVSQAEAAFLAMLAARGSPYQ